MYSIYNYLRLTFTKSTAILSAIAFAIVLIAGISTYQLTSKVLVTSEQLETYSLNPQQNIPIERGEYTAKGQPVNDANIARYKIGEVVAMYTARTSQQSKRISTQKSLVKVENSNGVRIIGKYCRLDEAQDAADESVSKPIVIFNYIPKVVTQNCPPIPPGRYFWSNNIFYNFKGVDKVYSYYSVEFEIVE